MAQNATVFIIDLDALKVINDQFGHDAGDRHLKLAADVIRNQFRPSDIVARIGGDEFAVLVRNAKVRDGVIYLERLRSALDGAMIAASVGMSYRLAHETLAGAVAAADAAMYQDKASRKAVPGLAIVNSPAPGGRREEDVA